MHEDTIISTIDLKSGYHHMNIHKEDVEKIAFTRRDGHYEFLVMPSVLQMHLLLLGKLWKILLDHI